MKYIVIVDEHGNEIVRRLLKEGEDPATVFKEEEANYLKSLRDGS